MYRQNTRQQNISETLWGNFSKFGTNDKLNRIRWSKCVFTKHLCGHNLTIHVRCMTKITNMSNRVQWWNNDIIYPGGQRSTFLRHFNVLQKPFFLFCQIKDTWSIHILDFSLSLQRHPNLKLCSPLQTHWFSDFELQVIVFAPCDQAFYQSSVLLCKN